MCNFVSTSEEVLKCRDNGLKILSFRIIQGQTSVTYPSLRSPVGLACMRVNLDKMD